MKEILADRRGRDKQKTKRRVTTQGLSNTL